MRQLSMKYVGGRLPVRENDGYKIRNYCAEDYEKMLDALTALTVKRYTSEELDSVILCKKGVKPEEKDIKITEEEEAVEAEVESEAVEAEEDSEGIEETDAEVTEETDAEDVEEEVEAEEDSEEKVEAVKAKAKPEAPEDPDKSAFVNLPFIEKCKKDPVIPIALLLAFVMIVVAVIYFLLPGVKAPAMKLTLDEFENGFNNCDTTVYFFESGFDISIKEINYVDRSAAPGILGELETLTFDSNYVDHFTGRASVRYDAGLEGATRKTDGRLTHIRVYIAYDQENSDDVIRVWTFFAATLQALYPDLTELDAKYMALSEMQNYAGDGMYIKRGDIAFRWIPVKPGVGGHESAYIVIEAVPAKTVGDEQIARTYEITDPSESESVAASDASVAST